MLNGHLCELLFESIQKMGCFLKEKYLNWFQILKKSHIWEIWTIFYIFLVLISLNWLFIFNCIHITFPAYDFQSNLTYKLALMVSKIKRGLKVTMLKIEEQSKCSKYCGSNTLLCPNNYCVKKNNVLNNSLLSSRIMCSTHYYVQKFTV